MKLAVMEILKRFLGRRSEIKVISYVYECVNAVMAKAYLLQNIICPFQSSTYDVVRLSCDVS